MDMATAFGADVTIEGPPPETEGYVFVKRRPEADHEAFVVWLLGVVGAPDRLLLHHRSGFAVVRLAFGRIGRLRSAPFVEAAGGIQFDAERFAAVTGATTPDAT
jgi:hypothetical protein